jgi:hypothetical protein
MYESSHDFKYDMVIRSRSDIEIRGEFDLVKFHNLLKDDPTLVLSPSNWRFEREWNNSIYNSNNVGHYLGQGMMCDQWFAATSNNMSNITKWVDLINEYISNGSRFHPETLLWWHVVKILKLKNAYMDFKNILRGLDVG